MASSSHLERDNWFSLLQSRINLLYPELVLFVGRVNLPWLAPRGLMGVIQDGMESEFNLDQQEFAIVGSRLQPLCSERRCVRQWKFCLCQGIFAK